MSTVQTIPLFSLIAGALTLMSVPANASDVEPGSTDRATSITEEARRYRSNPDRTDRPHRSYEELKKWRAPPTLAGPLFTIQTVYELADRSPIVSTDLGPGFRLGAIGPITRQAALLQNIIVGPNYAAISVGIP